MSIKRSNIEDALIDQIRRSERGIGRPRVRIGRAGRFGRGIGRNRVNRRINSLSSTPPSSSTPLSSTPVEKGTPAKLVELSKSTPAKTSTEDGRFLFETGLLNESNMEKGLPYALRNLFKKD